METRVVPISYMKTSPSDQIDRQGFNLAEIATQKYREFKRKEGSKNKIFSVNLYMKIFHEKVKAL